MTAVPLLQALCAAVSSEYVGVRARALSSLRIEKFQRQHAVEGFGCVRKNSAATLCDTPG